MIVIRPGQTSVGKQGFTYGAGASSETAGATKVCMNILPMPPGAIAKAHLHKEIETIAFLLKGDYCVYYGDGLSKKASVHEGEQCFWAADVPHAPHNDSGRPCTWVDGLAPGWLFIRREAIRTASSCFLNSDRRLAQRLKAA
jgi:uncharacterized RmlC-like cupin family protein